MISVIYIFCLFVFCQLDVTTCIAKILLSCFMYFVRYHTFCIKYVIGSNCGTKLLFRSLSSHLQCQMDHIPFWHFPGDAAGRGFGQGTADVIEFIGTLDLSNKTGPYNHMVGLRNENGCQIFVLFFRSIFWFRQTLHVLL